MYLGPLAESVARAQRVRVTLQRGEGWGAGGGAEPGLPAGSACGGNNGTGGSNGSTAKPWAVGGGGGGAGGIVLPGLSPPTRTTSGTTGWCGCLGKPWTAPTTLRVTCSVEHPNHFKTSLKLCLTWVHLTSAGMHLCTCPPTASLGFYHASSFDCPLDEPNGPRCSRLVHAPRPPDRCRWFRPRRRGQPDLSNHGRRIRRGQTVGRDPNGHPYQRFLLGHFGCR